MAEVSLVLWNYGKHSKQPQYSQLQPIDYVHVSIVYWL